MESVGYQPREIVAQGALLVKAALPVLTAATQDLDGLARREAPELVDVQRLIQPVIEEVRYGVAAAFFGFPAPAFPASAPGAGNAS